MINILRKELEFEKQLKKKIKFICFTKNIYLVIKY